MTVTSRRLELPVYPGTGQGWDAPGAGGAPTWKHRVLREGRSARRIEPDLLAGTRTLVVEEDGGEV